MATYADVQNEVLLTLEGFTNDQAVMCKVGGAGASDTATTITVTGGSFADGSGMSTGVWEIEDELVFVPDFNRATGVASNVIRGWRGTTAATRSVGAVIRNNPKFPVVQVRRAINDTIRNLFPRVPAILSHDLTLQVNTYRYQLPANCRQVLSVSAQDENANYAWTDLRTWKFVPRPLEGGTVIELPYNSRQRLVRVTYAAEPSPLLLSADDFATVTGLEEFAREAVVWGAVWRLYSTSELGRGYFSAADQTMMNRQSDFGKSTDISKYLLGVYQQAVTDAESRVQDMFPPVRHYVWG